MSISPIRLVFLIIAGNICFNSLNSIAAVNKIRLSWIDDPTTTICIGWDQISGDNPIVYYGTKDEGRDWEKYESTKKPTRLVTQLEMHTNFCKLSDLSPNAVYFFIIKDSEGLTDRFWFKTAPSKPDPFTCILGGDTKSKEPALSAGRFSNEMVPRLRPLFVMFCGDFTSGNATNPDDWKQWLTDWFELTQTEDGRLFPIVPIHGNHEAGIPGILNIIFNSPFQNNNPDDLYYSFSFGDDFFHFIALNSENKDLITQTNWLEKDLEKSKDFTFKVAAYHKPFRPHTKSKRENMDLYNLWAPLFKDFGLDISVDADSHMSKITFPIVPDSNKANEFFKRDDNNGTVYIGEGSWGAGPRENNDNKSWTLRSGSFNQFNWLQVFPDSDNEDARIDIRTVITSTRNSSNIAISHVENVEALSEDNVFAIPDGIDLFSTEPYGSVISYPFKSLQDTRINFENYFENKTMRLDYFHSGNSTEEHFAVDRILNDGIWSGSKNVLFDELNQGLYFFEVINKESDKLLYSRGFSSIFGEWQTIPEAEEKWGTYHESIRFPWPIDPVKILIKKRDSKNNFVQIWATEIDPSARSINRAYQSFDYTAFEYMINGPANEKLDIIVLGDGYTKGEMEKFHSDVFRLCDELFQVEPFKSRKQDFNVRAVETPSQVSGVNRPHPGIFKRTPLSVSYSSFDSERYALTCDNRTVRDVASTVPYDFMYILINEETYGGGGIYRLYSTVAVDNSFSDYVFVHEFGHSLAGLADEYYTSDVSYQPTEITIEPYEANITALLEGEKLKWNEFVESETPLPTPWEKKEYDKLSYNIQKERKALRAAKVPESEVEALFEKEKQKTSAILDNMEYTGKVGAFEGGGYLQYGYYRPYADCIMFTRNKQEFCPVCQDAINKVIDQYVK